MPHFSAEILDDDPEGALLLRDVLGPARGRAGKPSGLKPTAPIETPPAPVRGGRGAGPARPARSLAARALAAPGSVTASCPRS
ncbi:hypothetical protein [Methylobacterium isbiliense]|jgi:hypothetical protein|uniref:Uncharacterized protein n=1 Tax=Methylobacterium isbiliense TaxID=315478 RepID=A0ABQ4S8P7_9HYPH|nr:hypothetical protein [Methylobacterium isbiliense]MDN3621926.1 hypothetical protein [Methylobacterium isbiliense]GJD99560.1 hypothetical protein GMJLKIPL_1478 [Methylobacterium isbiliense]